MGKTEKGAIWLSAEKTSPYEFYQYFVNVADADVLMVLRFLSDVTQDEYLEIEASLPQKPGAAQRRLAESLTRLVHGESGLQSALRATQTLFGAEIDSLSERELSEIFADVPSSTKSRSLLESGLPLIDALVAVSLASSKGEARRSIEGGSVYVNNRKIATLDRVLTTTDLVGESVIVLRVGKKKYALLRFE